MSKDSRLGGAIEFDKALNPKPGDRKPGELVIPEQTSDTGNEELDKHKGFTYLDHPLGSVKMGHLEPQVSERIRQLMTIPFASLAAQIPPILYEDMENNVAKWIPGTGLTVTQTGGSLIYNTYCLRIEKDAANRNGNYVYIPFTISAADKNSLLTLTFGYLAGAGYAADGDFIVTIWDVTNSVEIGPSISSLPLLSGHFVTSFLTSSSTSYQIRIKVNVTTSVDEIYYLDNVMLTSFSAFYGTPYQASPISGWKTYTPVITNGATGATLTRGSVYTEKAIWRRVGDMMEIIYTYHQTTAGGSASGAADYCYSIPAGFTIDYARFQASDGAGTGWVAGGQGQAFRGDLSYYGDFHPFVSNYGTYYVNTIQLRSSYTGGAGITYGQGGWYFSGANVITVSFVARIPIAQWSVNVNLVSDFTEYLFNTTTDNTNDTTHFGYGIDGSLIPNRSVGTLCTKRVRSSRPIMSVDKVYIEAYDPIDGKWYPASERIGGKITLNTKQYGTGLNSVAGSTTDMDVEFGAGGYSPNSAATYGANGDAWSALYTAGWKWHVRIVRNGNMAESFPPLIDFNTLETPGAWLYSNAAPSANTWYEVNFSSVVPPGTKWVLLQVCSSTAAYRVFWDKVNTRSLASPMESLVISHDYTASGRGGGRVLVPVNSARKGYVAVENVNQDINVSFPIAVW